MSPNFLAENGHHLVAGTPNPPSSFCAVMVEESNGGGMGLDYFGARYLDNEVGMWMSVDPKGQDWNAYGYCNGNPAIFIDPNGELWEFIGLGLGAGIGWYVSGTLASSGELNPTKWDSETWFKSVIGGIQGGLTGYTLGAGIDAAIEHTSPTGVAAVDRQSTRDELSRLRNEQYAQKDPNNELISTGVTVDGKDQFIRGKSGYNTATPAEGLTLEQKHGSFVELHGHGMREDGSLNIEYTWPDRENAFPTNNRYYGKALTRIIYNETDFRIFTKQDQWGTYPFEASKLVSQEYYLRSFWERFLCHLRIF